MDVRQSRNPETDRHERYQFTLAAVRDALLHDATTHQYAHRLMTSYLRRIKGISVRQEDVREAMYTVHKELNSRRSFHHVRAYPPFPKYPGPDWMWYIDGQDKISLYGITIYAAIDVCSSRIMYVYIGNKNRYLHTDCDSAVTLMTEAHQTLYQRAQQLDASPTNEDIHRPSTECHVYETSTGNPRIEIGCLRLLRCQTRVWREYFHWLVRTGVYRINVTPHRVVFLYCFVPILRTVIHQFADLHNDIKITQRKIRPHQVVDRRRGLWNNRSNDDTDRHGFACPEELVNAKLMLVELYDLCSFITPNSVAWCEDYLSGRGLPIHPRGRDFIQAHADAPLACPSWFNEMLTRAIAYAIGGGELAESEVPRGAHEWLSEYNPPQTSPTESDEEDDVFSDESTEDEDLDTLKAKGDAENGIEDWQPLI